MNSYRLKKFEGSIFVCGFMASGKSTLGIEIAQKLDWDYLDLDQVIEEREGKSINEIFKKAGEPYFRKKEWEYLLDLTRTFRGVISLGGGALHDQKVVDHLKVNGLLVFVKTPIEEIIERVRNSHERPILFSESGEIKSKETLKEELKTLYSNREGYYQQAQISINTSTFTSIEEMAEKAIEKIIRYV